MVWDSEAAAHTSQVTPTRKVDKIFKKIYYAFPHFLKKTQLLQFFEVKLIYNNEQQNKQPNNRLLITSVK